MPKRTAQATWNGDLKSGKGTMTFGSGAYEGAYSFASRFEEGDGTNPEELIGAAHAGCFSMALSNELAQAGHQPESVHTVADVTLDLSGDGPSISTILLKVDAQVPDIDENTFREIAEGASKNCPVSRALTGVTVKLETTLNA
ncbi:MAG: OsmC family protein [Balneolaceae bacterium]|nr:OsmC family protein [Balneolaceae bacterium]